MNRVTKHISGRPTRLGMMVLLAAPLALLAACDDDSPTTPPPTTTWTAEFSGTGEYAAVTGATEVAAGVQTSSALVAVVGAEAGDAFAWYIAEGSCAEPGNALGEPGNYGLIEADGEGEGAATAAIGATLDNEETYHVELYLADDAAVTVACSALSRS